MKMENISGPGITGPFCVKCSIYRSKQVSGFYSIPKLTVYEVLEIIHPLSIILGHHYKLGLQINYDKKNTTTRVAVKYLITHIYL